MPSKNTTKPATSYARTLGSLAFASGIACVCGWDADLAAYMGRRQIGDPRSIPEMKAWIAGWTEANLAAAEAA